MKSKTIANGILAMVAITGLILCGCDADTWHLFVCSKLAGVGLLFLATKAGYLLNRGV